MELPVLQLNLRHQLKGSTTRHEYCNTSIVNLHCTSAQTLYDTCNPTSCVLNYLHQLNLSSPVNLFPTTRLSRAFRYTSNRVVASEKITSGNPVLPFISTISGYSCYQPHKPFCIVTAVCTVDLLILNTFAAALTVAPVSNIYSPNISALSFVASFIQQAPPIGFFTPVS